MDTTLEAGNQPRLTPEAFAERAIAVERDYYYAEVRSVDDAGVQPVYSLRVDTDDHSFLSSSTCNMVTPLTFRCQSWPNNPPIGVPLFVASP